MLLLKRLLLTTPALSLLVGCSNSRSVEGAGNALNAVNYGAATVAEVKSAREKKAQENFEQDLGRKMRKSK